MKKTLILSMACVALALSGCAAVQTSISKRNLDVQTKSSATIFLNPVPNYQKTVYVQIKNTSDKKSFNVKPGLVASLRSKGYKVTYNLRKAHYLLQANILRVGKTSPSAAEKMFKGGFGAGIAGAGVGVAAGALAGSGTAMLAGGLIGAAVGTIADSLVKDVTYAVVTDVQVSERIAGSIRQSSVSTLHQGTSAKIVHTSSGRVHWQRYQTRILSTAEKVNLKFPEAKPKLQAGLIDAISGIF